MNLSPFGVVNSVATAPIFLRIECLDFGLALTDQPERNRLHTSRRARSLQLSPQNRRQSEPNEIVKSATSLVGVDEPFIQIPRMLHRFENRSLSNLMEDYPLDIDILDGPLFFQGRQKMPGNGLSLPIRVRCEIKMLSAPLTALAMSAIRCFLSASGS